MPGYSLLRIALAYVLSLLFAVTLRDIFAAIARAQERFMIPPLLDVLQSPSPVFEFFSQR